MLPYDGLVHASLTTNIYVNRFSYCSVLLSQIEADEQIILAEVGRVDLLFLFYFFFLKILSVFTWVIGCGAAEATGLGFVCLLLSTLVCYQPTELIWAYIFQFHSPPPPGVHWRYIWGCSWVQCWSKGIFQRGWVGYQVLTINYCWTLQPLRFFHHINFLKHHLELTLPPMCGISNQSWFLGFLFYKFSFVLWVELILGFFQFYKNFLRFTPPPPDQP